MSNISLLDIIIFILFFITVIFVMRWLSEINRKIKQEEFIKKHYLDLLKKEEKETEVNNPEAKNQN